MGRYFNLSEKSKNKGSDRSNLNFNLSFQTINTGEGKIADFFLLNANRGLLEQSSWQRKIQFGWEKVILGILKLEIVTKSDRRGESRVIESDKWQKGGG